MQKEWEEVHAVQEELVEGPPSRRANATLTACPTGNYLWSIGGEFFSEDNKAYFYNDVFRYNPEKDEWRKFVSKNCPGPRSAHAIVGSPAGGGKLFLFGGEFSSVNQSTFHHYGDFWCFDITTRTWDRIDTKIRPSPRSGHRMAIWKHYIVLFGGFYDPGITTRYHNDLWVFDTQEYLWRQIEFRENEIQPSPRSGFSFLSTPEGIVLHGGYCKEYSKGKRPIGVMLEDTWFLNMTLQEQEDTTSTARSKKVDPLKVKWERRKRPSTAYAPPLRSGCTMTSWTAKSTGVLFGGVTDEDTSEETLESIFWNDLYGYQWLGKGRWISLALKRPKGKPKGAKRKAAQRQGGSDQEAEEDQPSMEDRDPNDPELTRPIPRYNAMLAVLRNTLYIYGGIFERGSKEYTLDDFYSLQLDKLDRFVCLKESGVIIQEGDEESSEDDDDDDDTGEDDDEGEDEDAEDADSKGDGGDKRALASEEKQIFGKLKKMEGLEVADEDAGGPDELRSKAEAFMGVSKDKTRSEEEMISTPLPGETLAMFYSRSREYWAQKALSGDSHYIRGKQLRRGGFALAEERYKEYKPMLKEVEKILAEAGLNEEEIRRGAAARGAGPSGQSRNRR